MNESVYPQMKIIETKEYILRPADISDTADMFEYYNKEKVVKYLPFNKHKDIKETKRFIKDFFIRNYKQGKVGHWAVVSRKDKKVIGNCGLNNIKVDSKEGEIGICINPNYWGDDISTKIAKLLLQYGFDYLNLEKIIAITYEDNKYSCKSLEVIGFTYIDSYRKKLKHKSTLDYVICHRFEITKIEYLAKKRNLIKEKI